MSFCVSLWCAYSILHDASCEVFQLCAVHCSIWRAVRNFDTLTKHALCGNLAMAWVCLSRILTVSLNTPHTASCICEVEFLICVCNTFVKRATRLALYFSWCLSRTTSFCVIINILELVPPCTGAVESHQHKMYRILKQLITEILLVVKSFSGRITCHQSLA